MFSFNIYNFPAVPLTVISLILFCFSSFFFENRNKYFSLTLLIFFFIVTPQIIRFILLTDFIATDVLRYLTYSLSCAVCGSFILVFLNYSKYIKPLKYLFFIPLIIAVTIFYAYFFIQHSCLNVDAVIAIWQTNFKEASEYIFQYLNIFQLITAVALISLSLFLLHGLSVNSIKKFSNKQLEIALIVLIFVLNIFVCRYTSGNTITFVFVNAGRDINEYMKFKENLVNRKNKIAQSEILSRIKTAENKGIYFLIIGESHNRDYLSAYGYIRDNSPWLNSMEKENNFIRFTNVYACHTQTVPALSFALTQTNQYNSVKLQDAVSILEVAEKAGYETVWLSNQVKYGVWDTPISVIASAASQQHWLNNFSGNSNLTASYDGELIRALGNIKIKDKMLIIIHLMGSHIDYQMRYPKQFAKFGEKTDEASYSNSLLYNDFVMRKIYGKAKKMPNFKMLLYFSDHASVPKHKLDHDSSRFTPSMTHIPMYICYSDSYRMQNSKKIKTLKQHADSCFTNDLLFNLILSLMNIAPEEYEARNNLASVKYDGKTERFKTSRGKRNIVKK